MQVEWRGWRKQHRGGGLAAILASNNYSLQIDWHAATQSAVCPVFRINSNCFKSLSRQPEHSVFRCKFISISPQETFSEERKKMPSSAYIISIKSDDERKHGWIGAFLWALQQCRGAFRPFSFGLPHEGEAERKYCSGMAEPNMNRWKDQAGPHFNYFSQH